ncbi:restriction endonuclease subunit S [Actinoplanes sp. NPDC026623]|uniref:restriction endonuclease subunit S n=1 Tax=Actinoplanes sp. NPDC026623 TaxID=3155610 RepID=UPI0033D9B694
MTHDLKPYGEYADFGIPWLGELPAHWITRRAKYFYREVDERSTTGAEELLSVSHLTGVTSRQEKNVTMFRAATNVGHKICRPNDIVINTMWAWMAALGVARQEGLVSPAYGVYRPLNAWTLAPAFAERLLRTPTYAAEYTRRSTGVNSSRLRLYPDEFLRIPIVCPPEDEQSAIVRFLSDADQRISRYIRAKQKLIKLLEEQKQAIIYHAVTRGLDPSVRLKPSNVKWLGDVPEHWSRVAIRQLAARGRSTFVNGPFGSDLLTTELMLAGVPVIYIRDISRGIYLRVSKVHVTAEKAAKLEFCNVAAGDVLIAKVGDPPGTAATYPSGQPNGIVTQDVIRIRPDTSRVIADYLVTYLNSRAGRVAVGPVVVESTRGRVSLPDFRAVPVFLPSLVEQRAILDEIASLTADISTTVGKTQREIDLLREYRIRLISDVVTGKLDVREAAARLSGEAESPTELLDGEDTLGESATEDYLATEDLGDDGEVA